MTFDPVAQLSGPARQLLGHVRLHIQACRRQGHSNPAEPGGSGGGRPANVGIGRTPNSVTIVLSTRQWTLSVRSSQLECLQSKSPTILFSFSPETLVYFAARETALCCCTGLQEGGRLTARTVFQCASASVVQRRRFWRKLIPVPVTTDHSVKKHPCVRICLAYCTMHYIYEC